MFLSGKAEIVYVALPFGGWAGRHAQGLLQVEFSSGDAVGRLRQTDAAVPEELEAAGGALLLQHNHTHQTSAQEL